MNMNTFLNLDVDIFSLSLCVCVLHSTLQYCIIKSYLIDSFSCISYDSSLSSPTTTAIHTRLRAYVTTSLHLLLYTVTFIPSFPPFSLFQSLSLPPIFISFSSISIICFLLLRNQFNRHPSSLPPFILIFILYISSFALSS